MKERPTTLGGPGNVADPPAQLSLRWIYLAWTGLGFTVLVFTVFGFVTGGEPEVLVAALFGDVPLFSFVAYTVGLVLSVLVLWRLLSRAALSWESVGFRGRLTHRGALSAGLGWLAAFLLFYVVETGVTSLGLPMFWNEESMFSLETTSHVIVICCAAILVAPIAEEIIYRGYLLEALRRRLPTPAAVVLSSLIFASIHAALGPGMVLYIFLGAFIPAYLYLRFGNIYPCILMHLLNNVTAYIVIPLVVGSAAG